MIKKCLPKKSRLLNSNEFMFVFKQPKRTKTIHGITLFSRSNQLGFPRIGIAIAKKYIKHAHERNRIKRHIRETFRINQYNLLSADFIVTIHSKEIIYLKNHLLITTLENLWYHHLY